MSNILALGDRIDTTLPAKDRLVTFSAVVAMHCGLIVLFVMSRPAEEQRQKQGSLSVFAVAAAAPMARPIPTTVPVIPAKSEPVSPSAEEIFAEQQAATGDPDGEVCSPVDVVSAQLVNDPIVPEAIGRVSRDDRSVSEAIVMWNAEWTSATIEENAPLAEVRNRILIALADMPPDCLATPVLGPRLIAIAEEGGTTTFLAFGSGEWTWQQLIEPAADVASAEKYSWTWDELIAKNLSSDFF